MNVCSPLEIPFSSSKKLNSKSKLLSVSSGSLGLFSANPYIGLSKGPKSLIPSSKCEFPELEGIVVCPELNPLSATSAVANLSLCNSE